MLSLLSVPNIYYFSCVYDFSLLTFNCFLFKGVRLSSMEDKKTARVGGTKVSEIANIFQGKVPSREDIITPLRTKTKVNNSNPNSEKVELESPAVTVMRTESHVARFNNARALFEKLGEENRSKDRIIPLQSTKSASSILDLRSRSSSANSETRDTKSHHGSRSPSPKRNDSIDKFSNSVPVLNDNCSAKKSNGFSHSVASDNVSKATGNVEERTKPNVMKKPEKPERKFNSKELIEKQRNWTSHFNKSRSSRYHSDPNKSEVKLVVNNGNKEVICDNKSAAVRSSSFSSRMRSPPTSPPSPPIRNESAKRTNVVRRERPTSVIPTVHASPLKRDYSSPNISPSKPSSNRDYNRKERASSLIITSNDKINEKENVLSPTRKYVPRNLFKRDNDEKENKKDISSKPSNQNDINRSPLEDKDASKENLSATSGSLSSLSPPSSPSKLKTENEKQEQEDNEKYLGEY